MKKRLFFLPVIPALLLCLTAPALGAGGSAADPVVSQSYVEKTFTEQLNRSAAAAIHRGLGRSYRDNLLLVTEAVAAQRLVDAQPAAATPQKAAGRVTCRQGDVLTPAPGCKVTLLSGVMEADTARLIDVTHGRAAARSSRLAARTLYMMGDDDSGALRALSPACELTVDGVYRLTPGAGIDYGSLAAALQEMGLFRGATNGYALEAGASRAEGLVMFLRLLGLEDEALAYTGGSPFTDVPRSHWAYRYVAYAHAQGLTSGTGAATFSPERPITCQHYATFLLRALHYGEGTDFSYDTAVEDLTELDLFTPAETASLRAGTFFRYKMVYLSYYALYGVDQASGRLLMNELTAAGAVQRRALSAGLCRAVGPRIR